MRTLGKYMLGSGATFGYVLRNSLRFYVYLSVLYVRLDNTNHTLLIVSSCPSAALFVPKALTTMPGSALADPR